MCLCLQPKVWIVGAVHDVEYGGHLDAGRGAHLLKQRLQVEPSAYIFGLDFAFIFIFGVKIMQSKDFYFAFQKLISVMGPGLSPFKRSSWDPFERTSSTWMCGRWASSNFYKRGWDLVSPMYDKTGRSDLVSPLDDQALNGNLQLAVHLPTITLSHLWCSKSFWGYLMC